MAKKEPLYPHVPKSRQMVEKTTEKPVELRFLEEFFRRLGVSPGQSVTLGEENIARDTGHTVAEVRRIAREVSRDILRR